MTTQDGGTHDSPVSSFHGLAKGSRANQSPVSSLYLAGILSDFPLGGLYIYARTIVAPILKSRVTCRMMMYLDAQVRLRVDSEG